LRYQRATDTKQFGRCICAAIARYISGIDLYAESDTRPTSFGWFTRRIVDATIDRPHKTNGPNLKFCSRQRGGIQCHLSQTIQEKRIRRPNIRSLRSRSKYEKAMQG
jgi:hypothetical protein